MALTGILLGVGPVRVDVARRGFVLAEMYRGVGLVPHQ